MRIKTPTEYGIKAQGKAELTKHEQGKRLTYRQMVLAKCYECTAGYTDGKVDCGIPGCPLYQKMPYKSSGDSENPYVQELSHAS